MIHVWSFSTWLPTRRLLNGQVAVLCCLCSHYMLLLSLLKHKNKDAIVQKKLLEQETVAIMGRKGLLINWWIKKDMDLKIVLFFRKMVIHVCYCCFLPFSITWPPWKRCITSRLRHSQFHHSHCHSRTSQIQYIAMQGSRETLPNKISIRNRELQVNNDSSCKPWKAEKMKAAVTTCLGKNIQFTENYLLYLHEMTSAECAP